MQSNRFLVVFLTTFVFVHCTFLHGKSHQNNLNRGLCRYFFLDVRSHLTAHFLHVKYEGEVIQERVSREHFQKVRRKTFTGKVLVRWFKEKQKDSAA